MRGLLARLWALDWLRIAVFSIIGIAFVVSGYNQYRKAARLANEGVEASGVVVEIEQSPSRRFPRRYPHVEFKDAAGVTHRIKGSDHGTAQRGDAVAVIYWPDDPTVADVQGGYGLSSNSHLLTMGFGVFFIGVAGYIGYTRRKADKARERLASAMRAPRSKR